MKRAKDYRQEAHALLNNDLFAKPFLYAVLVIFVVSAITAAIDVIPYAGFLVMLVIGGPITYGTLTILLRFIRREDEFPNLNHLFDGFKDKFGDCIITELLETVFLVLWTLLLIIPGIIKSYSYSLTMYLVRERNLTGNEAITKSREMMDGHKWELFCLDLSFIGWYLLGILCLGVGVFWAGAYHEVARTLFIEELLKQPEVIDAK